MQMKPKEYLRQYLNAEREIQAKLDYISRLREMLLKVSPTLTPDKIQSSHENTAQATITKIVDMEKEVEQQIEQLKAIKNEVEGVIDQMSDPTYRVLLRRRYINGETFEKIAVEMGYSWRQVIRIHELALSKMS